MRLEPAVSFMAIACVALALAPVTACGGNESAGTPQPDISLFDDAGDASGDAGVDTDDGPDLAPCADNTECRGGEVCRDGFCREACAEDDPCQGELPACDASLGYCVECAEDGDCAGGERCSSGECVEVECTSDADCSGGFRCDDFACVPIDDLVCEPGEATCSDDGLAVIRCSRDGTSETTEACGAGDVCVASEGSASCEPVLCEPGANGCVDAETRFVCDDTGTIRDEFACDDGERCVGGVCRSAACDPGAVFCDGNAVVTCGDDGGVSGIEPCAGAEDCIDTEAGCACTDGACVPRVCRPGEARCVGSGIQRCGDDGVWLDLADCRRGRSCVGGACLDDDCEPGAEVCAGDAILGCGDAGWAPLEDCAADGGVCINDEVTVACFDRVCTPDTSRCSEARDATFACDALGRSETRAACAAGTVCDRGVCVGQVCTPGADATCSESGAVVRCDTWGLGFVVADSCDGEGEACIDGRCERTICEPGTRRCDGDQLLVCDADGRGETAEDCGADGGTCDPVEQACVDLVCEPSAVYCDLGDVFVCDAAGTRATRVRSCMGAGCEDGTCVGEACSLDEITCSVLGGSSGVGGVTAESGDTVVCTPTGPGGIAGRSFTWQRLSEPEGSTGTPSFVDTAELRFTPLAIGRYLYRVRTEGCAAATVVVTVAADAGFTIELVWDTPDDPDPTDTGSGLGADMDIHLRHQNGCWGDRDWDCHWRATQPNWGERGTTDDDPLLALDDSDGWGPEIIEFDGLEADVTYTLGVEYYNDHSYGGSTATVRVFEAGLLVFEAEREMPTRGQFWTVATLDGATGDLTLVDDLDPTAPTCD